MADPLLLKQAGEAARRGRLQSAEKKLERFLRKEPSHLQALHMAAVVDHQRGRNRRAGHRMAKVLEMRPHWPEGWFILGEICRAQGDLAGSMAAYKRAESQGLAGGDLYFGWGVVALEAGKPEPAHLLLTQATAKNPKDAMAWNNLGQACIQLSWFYQARDAIEHALELSPENAGVKGNLADALDRLGDYAKAATLYRELAARDQSPRLLARLAASRCASTSGPDWSILSDTAKDTVQQEEFLVLCLERLRQLGQLQTVAQLALRALEEFPESGRLWGLLGQAQYQLGEPSALESLQRASALCPDDPAIRRHLGSVLQARGDFDGAGAAYQEALKRDPDDHEVRYALLAIHQQNPEPALIARLEQGLADPKLSLDRRIAAGFTLGEVNRRNGETDAAFAAFRQANQLQRRQRPFNRQGHQAMIKDLMDFFTADFFRTQQEPVISTSEAPLFVVGMPRSGTTLVEQILASHSRVFGAGEVNTLAAITTELGQEMDAGGYPRCLLSLSQASLQILAQRYLLPLEKAARVAKGEVSRIVDKLPGNYARLGLIARLFPDARVIHVQREPADLALSCYSTHFGKRLNFTNDLQDLAAVWKAYMHLTEHWQSVLPLQQMSVRYEELVADPETVSREMVAFAGLEWEPGCLEFHRNIQEVRSASLWQVRQPTYQSSVGYWRQYEAHLEPFLQAIR